MLHKFCSPIFPLDFFVLLSHLHTNMLFFFVGNFLVSKEPPHKPILLDFGLTKRISQSMKQALAKMFLSCAEVCNILILQIIHMASKSKSIFCSYKQQAFP